MLTQIGPDGLTTNYTYDELGRVWTIDRGVLGVVYQYDEASRLETVTYANGATTGYT